MSSSNNSPGPEHGSNTTSSMTKITKSEEGEKPKKAMPEWQVMALDELRNSDMSYAEIAAKHGRARDTLFKLARLHQISREKPEKVVRRTTPLSRSHKALGMRLSVFRGDRHYSVVAALIGISRHKYQKMEMGTEEVTLTQLLRMTDVLETSIEELTAEFTAVVAMKRKK